jgi:hypothetical protein
MTLDDSAILLLIYLTVQFQVKAHQMGLTKKSAPFLEERGLKCKFDYHTKSTWQN